MIWATIGAGVLALIALVMWLHHLFEGERLLRDLWREWRLSRKSLAEVDAAWAAAPDRSDIEISLTTIPSRIGMIEQTLKGLLDQTRPPKRVVLNVPEYSEREKRPYEIPEVLLGLSGVRIRRCRDWGPATKMIPALLEAEPDAPVLVADDDRIYPARFVEWAERWAAERPDAALTFAGWEVPADLIDRPTTIWSNLFMRAPAPVRGHRLRRPRETDVFMGVMGYLVRPRFYDLEALTDFSRTPRAGFLVDDVRSSALCRAPRLVIPAGGLSFLPKARYGAFKETALANLNRGSGAPEDRNNSIAVRHYADRWRVGGRPRP
ncbi:hypothetical protein SAMN04490248_1063 [Salinihabitans flavidus]|uniref:Glycosyl transferase family 2 n=1 Tax=Salinihabitans flavidus TaxID=569882 RepID=A0A1H8Q523_9RHOB|nr:hypothetical protein [Salinihabitans flavidus]SEO49017.1 hypothetical protein SAMN04490248_1063 [Salinihabitans flavidus]